MPKVTAAVLAALVALTLTGCAASAESAADERTAPAVTESAAPLVAEETTEPATPTTPDEIYLERVRAELPQNTVIPNATDEQLLDAAEDACSQIAEGVDVLAVQVVQGEAPNGLGYYESSAKIGAIAAETFCPVY